MRCGLFILKLVGNFCLNFISFIVLYYSSQRKLQPCSKRVGFIIKVMVEVSCLQLRIV